MGGVGGPGPRHRYSGATFSKNEAQRPEQLREAIGARDLIGQGKGILMEREKIDDETAFGRLVRASQDLNVKLIDVARHLTETGELFGTAFAASS